MGLHQIPKEQYQYLFIHILRPDVYLIELKNEKPAGKCTSHQIIDTGDETDMCNIAAYIGHRQAAPILIDMLRKQEGYDSGFFTGIATIDDSGTIHMRKVVGDLEHLLNNTDAFDLPGTTGFIHGRTPGFGDASWAHPFWSHDQTLVMILNGTIGYFTDLEASTKVCRELEEKGYQFRTALPDDKDGGPRTTDGLKIHPSELRTFLVEDHIKRCGDKAMGMRRAIEELPGEIVSLMLYQGDPDHMYISRVSMPMMVARSERELYTASAAFAFPDDQGIHSITSLQPKTMNVLSLDKIESIDHNIKVPVINHLPWRTGEDKIVEVLKQQGPINMGTLREHLNPIWPQDMLPQKNHFLYHLLPDMKQRGIINLNEVRIPGKEKTMTAPSVEISLTY